MKVAVSGAAVRREMRAVAPAAAVLLAVVAAVVCLTAFGRTAEQRLWLASWSAAQMAAVDVWEPNWSTTGFADHTVRQTVRPTLGGDRARIALSNLFGKQPLRITAATVAQTARGAAVRPDTVRPVLFDGAPTTVIPPGAESSGDAIDFTVTAREPITVTLYLADATGPATFHDLSNAISYRARGDHHADIDDTAFTESDESWYYLSEIRVSGAAARDGVVTFGDSLTDGAGATTGSDNRYPDVLADRLAAGGDTRAVLNAGIAGNRIVSESDYVGQRAATRFRRDVLDKEGAGTVILLSGINDIGASRLDSPWLRPNPDVTPEQLIAEYRQLIDLARDDGLRIIAGTLLPYQGATYYSEHGEAVRDRVNFWIRESGEFDTVIDFDRLLAAGSDPDVLSPRYDSGDHLHPNPAGYAAMADAAAAALDAADRNG
ncbi:SGNH/GDSL hydrolase family protein [Nocardia sp. NBC_00416]|uniref:SGNH/GDSL hydrolase family protein n=1 Tax=Nocardia sp. NBC_00416 TaxID=2975991 RepID=UPI002E1FFF0E